MANTKVTYIYSGTDEFPIPFSYLSSTDLTVRVNGVTVTFTITGTSLTPDIVLSTDDEVVIERITDIDEPRVVFDDPSALLETDLNTQVSQLIYALQEFDTRLDGISTSSEGGELPGMSDVGQFLVSVSDGLGGYIWQVKTTAQVAAILGIGASLVPTPVAGPKFLLTNASSATYELKTVADVQTLLGVGSNQLPAIANRASHILFTNTAGNAYELVSAVNARARMGLGNAALLNTGTGIGNVVTVVSSGSGPALPALYGGNLTGVQKTLDVTIWSLFPSTAKILAATNSSTASSTNWESLSAGIAETMAPTTPGWTQTRAEGVSLAPGKYLVEGEAAIYGNVSTTRLRLYFNDNGPITTFEGAPLTLQDTTASGDSNQGSGSVDATRDASWKLGRINTARVRGIITATAPLGDNFLAMDINRIWAKDSDHTFAGNQNYPQARLTITKIA